MTNTTMTKTMKANHYLTALVALAAVLLAMLAATLLTAAVRPAEAAFPGQNGKIVLTRVQADKNFEIYSMNPDGSAQTDLSNDPSQDTTPAVSPDGKKVAFSSDRAGGQQDIYLMDADPSTKDAADLTNTGSARELEPAFSPDGTKIAFTTNRDGNAEVYVMNADGSGQVRLTKNAAVDLFPDFSPGGKKIAFTSNRDGDEEIFKMNSLDGTRVVKLTKNTSFDDAEPAFSPDGTKIAFRSVRTGQQQIFEMNPNGTNQTNVSKTDSPVQNISPDWGVASF